jgi:hypothetical protein
MRDTTTLLPYSSLDRHLPPLLRQIISTRVDIFPPQYTSKLALLQDSLDPIDSEAVKDVVRKELLQGAPLSDLFEWFDDTPLGSASIAQVHKAKLLDGRVVAVKVQRPGIKDKLLGDIGNLITFALTIKVVFYVYMVQVDMCASFFPSLSAFLLPNKQPHIRRPHTRIHLSQWRHIGLVTHRLL